MSLKRRPIDPFKLVYIHDDALDVLPDKLMREYADSNREWNVIAEAVAALKDKPVVFTCDPLKPSYDALGVTGLISDMKTIFAAHVRGVENVPDDMRPKFIKRDESQYLDMEYVDTFELAWIMDVASTIVGRGLGSVSPFTLPDTFWRGRSRRHVLAHAKSLSRTAPMTDTASDENTKNAES